MGRAGRVLQPIALRDGRLHRLLPVRGGRDGARPGIRCARAGSCGRPSPGSVARTPEKPGRLPDLLLPGRLRPSLRDVAAPVARAAALAGGAGGVPGPQIRRDRHPLCGLAQDRCADCAVVRRPDDESLGVGRPGARRADFRGAGSRADPGVRSFRGGGRHCRCRARARRPRRRPDRLFRRQRSAHPNSRRPPRPPATTKPGGSPARQPFRPRESRRTSIRRAAHHRPRRHRRGRRTQPPVRRSGRRGDQGRKFGIPGRIATGPGRRGDERIVRLDTSQQSGVRRGSAQRRG